MNFIVPAKLARKNLGELLDRAFYQGTPFLVTRGKRTVAAVVGAKEFQSYLKYVEEHDPGLADTLALLSNPEVQAILEQGEAAIKAGEVVPLEEVINDQWGMYRVVFSNPATRIVRKLPREIQAVLVQQAEILKTEPMKGEQLKGKYRWLRSLHLSYKGTAYRIIYQVVSKPQIVFVFLADKRENIYRRLEHIGDIRSTLLVYVRAPPGTRCTTAGTSQRSRTEGPYYRAARYPGEDVAGIVYNQAQELIYTTPCDLSAFRLQLRSVWHVALLGSQPPAELADHIDQLLSTGEPITLPEDVLTYLTTRRARATEIGPWVEGHYRQRKRPKRWYISELGNGTPSYSIE
jgi:mRNA-degrading endonuclease RelE of RelBE toxin-antitoxin system/PHD/YefM family antitoxin component YafN of YafNO toxin-antitoxin module